jgi:hypothetical protein
MKKLSFLLVALLVTGVAFAEKNCKKKAGGKACCKKEAGAKACCKKGGEATEAHNEATTEGASHSITYNSAAAAPKACCKKGGEGKACNKKVAAAESAVRATAVEVK